MPPSFSAIEYKCWNSLHSPLAYELEDDTMLDLLPDIVDVEVSDDCNCRLILMRSNGAVMHRAPRPAAAPASKSCQ